MKITEDVHIIDEASANWAHSNVYLSINGNDLVVIDTGTTGKAQKIVKYVEKQGYKRTDVKTVILTHYHLDHAGSAFELKELTGAKIAIHEEDADFVSGKKPYPKLSERFFTGLLSAFSGFKHVQPDVRLEDNNKINGLRIIHTSGHTIGSIAVLDETRKVLFAGDTLRTKNGEVDGPEKGLSFDIKKAQESIQKIATLDFDVLLVGHGLPLKSDASKAVTLYCDRIK